MTQVYEAIKTDSFTRIMVELQKALIVFPAYKGVGVNVLATEIYRNKRMPTEEEVEEAINGISPERLHQSVIKNEQQQEAFKNLPKCPACGSTKLQKLGIGTRAIDGFFFGRMSPEARAQFWCRNCDYRF